ncbi:MAG: UDP-N-acetylmuramate dehydrogenase [Caulobacteraceae bacterium]
MSWRRHLPSVRGSLLFDEPLAPLTWLRVGGPAEVLFLPSDEDDLAQFLGRLDPHVAVTALGVGSNLLVRDGGLAGVVVRLAGKGFGEVFVEPDGAGVVAGAASLDASLARAAARSGLAGLEFYAGIPGTVGGAITMNAGCYGAETAGALVAAWGVDRGGERRVFSAADLGYAYRSSNPPAAVIWTGAVFRARPGDPEEIDARMKEITGRRQATQPIREKTGGSTFKNPPGLSAWRLIEEAGWRGRPLGGAMFSPLHANFLINTGEATAADLETLGETVRAEVAARSGVALEWEIKRVGRPAPSSGDFR